MRHSAGELAAMLAGRAEALARELLPGGKREGREWVAASLTGTSKRALSVCIAGTKAGRWADFSGTLRGDAFDLVAVVLFNGDKKLAYKWALSWLGLSAGSGPAPVPRPRPPEATAAEEAAHEGATRRAALRLFLAGRVELRGTPVDLYLRGRGIDLAELARQPRSLRFHPACRCTEIEGDLPAMLAAICAPDGQHVATHRTWLAEIAGVWRKAPLQAPKKTLGRYVGGTIRLWRGASAKPLADVKENETIVIGEGIENCLSVALARPDLRVLAAVSLANLARVVLPPQAIDLIIAADNDTGNTGAEITLQRAIDRLMMEGRSVRVARSSIGKDFNEALTLG